MPLKFTSKEKRDELAERLLGLANHMQQSFHQGHDGRINVTDEMVGDIETAVAVVSLSEIFTVEEIQQTEFINQQRTNND